MRYPFVVVEPARKLATFEDLLRLGDDVRAEVFDGHVIVSPPPLPEHGRVQRSLSRYLGGPFDDDDGRGGPGGWWILSEVDVQLAPHQLVRPDLAGWRRERLPSPWGRRPLEVVPDWICEIVSPARPADDRVKKRRIYAAHGVPFYWIVDPAARTIEALRLDREASEWREIGAYDGAEESTARIPPFEAIELEIGRVFPPRPPEP
jgi:Uma2 family endonuclease